MTLKNQFAPDLVSDMEKLGQIRQNLTPERWTFFKALMFTYINGMEAGIALERDSQSKAG